VGIGRTDTVLKLSVEIHILNSFWLLYARTSSYIITSVKLLKTAWFTIFLFIVLCKKFPQKKYTHLQA